MNKIIRHLYHQTELGYFLIHPFKSMYDFYRYRLISEKTFLKREFEKKLGYKLNLENPKTLNEKIQWLKLKDRTPLHTLVADKYTVRKYIKEKIGAEYLIPLVYQTRNPLDIKPENLPDFPVIIKTNHDSSIKTIVRDKSKINWHKVRKDLARQLKRNYYYQNKEWQYKNIEPRVIVEKLLMDKNGNIPFDYKLHCFNGKLVFIQVDIDRQIDHKRNIYDTDWNFINCQWIYKNGDIVEKPKSFDRMHSIAKTLAQDFYYVRVDLYNLEGEIYFGELTFHSESGLGAFVPTKWDHNFGNILKLPLTKESA